MIIIKRIRPKTAESSNRFCFKQMSSLIINLGGGGYRLRPLLIASVVNKWQYFVINPALKLFSHRNAGF